jgi:hypothetical protein
MEISLRTNPEMKKTRVDTINEIHIYVAFKASSTKCVRKHEWHVSKK